MKDNLKRCPFCGKKPEIHVAPMRGKTKYVVICVDCCNGFPKDTPEEAIKAWNKRVPLACFDEIEVAE